MLIDAPPARLGMEPVIDVAKKSDLVVIHTSTPSFAKDAEVAQILKDANPRLKIGLVGAKVAVQPNESMAGAPAVDFVARNEFDFTIKEVAEGRDFAEIDGITYRRADGTLAANRERAVLEDMDSLPFVSEVYKKNLRIEDYFIGYLQHPYVSIYTGRGCKSRCTFCLWPQTVGGHRYRTRSPEHVAAEIAYIQKNFPQVREIFFDDDTFTDDLPRAEAIARLLGKMGVTWSCNAKANVPRDTLKVLKDNGLRLLLVGYESGNQQILHNIKKGMLVDVAREFTKNCHELGIKIHGTFILGLPGETTETIQQTIQFAKDINPHTLQVSLAAPYPAGTFLHKQAIENNWFDADNAELIDEHGVADGAAALPASVAHRDPRKRRDVLPEVLFPGAEDRVDRGRDGDLAADDEAAPARRRGVLPLPARAPRRLIARPLSVVARAVRANVIVSADDFGLSESVNEAIERAAARRHPHHRQPDGGGCRGGRCRRARAAPAAIARGAASRGDRGCRHAPASRDRAAHRSRDQLVSLRPAGARPPLLLLPRRPSRTSIARSVPNTRASPPPASCSTMRTRTSTCISTRRSVAS